MGPKKKKGGKAAVNRGFATTSIPSRSKQNPEEEFTPNDSNISTPANEAVSASVEAETKSLNPRHANDESANFVQEAKDSSASRNATYKDLHELTPEELDARLERESLSSFVDKYGPKCARDAGRQTAKIATDNRLLRTQAELLNSRSLLPGDSLGDIVKLAKDDVSCGCYNSILTKPTVPANKRSATGDEYIAKLWTLQRCLLSVGFSSHAVDDALRHVLHYPPLVDIGASVWGLEETLDWLALHLEDEEIPLLDAKARSKNVVTLDTGTPSDSEAVPDAKEKPILSKATDSDTDVTKTNASMISSVDVSATEENGIDVSDVESDLDESAMLAKYLSTKSKLYQIQPELADSNDTRKGKKGRDANIGHASSSKATKKLFQNLERLRSDVLFDSDEAERQWFERRIDLIRERAEMKRLGVSNNLPNWKSEKANIATAQPQLSSSSMKPHETSNGNNSGSDDEGFVGDLFAAVPGSEQHSEPTIDMNGDASGIVIRDFGRTQGLSPRRVLEDACHARDSTSKVSHQIVSKVAFSCRSQLVVTWSKEQSTELPLEMNGVQCSPQPHRSQFTMAHVATPDRTQSEHFVSTIALFQLFSTSAKEEKVYMRLPPAWKDLWFELSEKRKAQAEEIDRNTVKALRELVQSEVADEDEDTIHFANLKRRANDSRSQSRPPSPESLDLQTGQGDVLKQIWQRTSSNSAFQHMLDVRSKLPMWAFKQQVISAVEESQVTILCGETGCGKSTQMPSFILESQLSQGKACKIYCTEPRRISAITLAQRVSQELGEHKGAVGNQGSLVGYSIRLESQVASSTRLVFATTGIVLRMLESANGFQDVTHIIVDEVHERSIETDFLLIILKSLLITRPELKVVLMSATVDAQRFSSYFQGAPVLNVPGRTFPVETKYLEDAIELTKHVINNDGSDGLVDNDADFEGQVEDNKTGKAIGNLQGYSNATRNTLMKFDERRIDYELILKLIESISKDPELNQYSKAILVFLPGLAEIRRMGDVLSGSSLARDFLVHSLHSSVASEDQQRAFDMPPRGLRKIVLSTNIAETGVTIPDITCVIDTGKHKEMRFDERRQISRLIESFISRANAKQRRGRAGRVQHGLAFHLFTKSRHDLNMTDQQTPEMLRLSLQDLIMRVKVCKLGDIQETLAQALDPPQAKNIRRAIDTLIDVGALTASEDLTPLGHQLANLPLDPYLGKLILFGSLYGCLDIALTIAAILTSKSPFVIPVDSRKQGDIARLAFKKGDSDLLTEFNAYASWRRVCEAGNMSESQFCKRNMLSLQTLCNIEDLKVQLIGQLADAGFVSLTKTERSQLPRNQPLHLSRNKPRDFLALPSSLITHNDNVELVSTGLTWSFYPKLLVREGKGWRSVSSSQAITLHPTSVLRSGDVNRDIKFLSFYSVLQSSSATKNYNALSLTPSFPLALILFAATSGASANAQSYDSGSSFHHTSLTISLDNGRLRFALPTSSTTSTINRAYSIGPWKALVALKYLRRRMAEYMDRRWRGSSTSKTRGDGGSAANIPQRLVKWVEVWDGCVQAWADEARKR